MQARKQKKTTHTVTNTNILPHTDYLTFISVRKRKEKTTLKRYMCTGAYTWMYVNMCKFTHKFTYTHTHTHQVLQNTYTTFTEAKGFMDDELEQDILQRISWN